MTSFNRITLIGLLEGSPDIRLTESGESVLRFSVSADRPSSGDAIPQRDVIPVVGFGQLAEAGERLSDQSCVLVEGRIHVRTVDNPDGSRKWVTEVIASEIRPLALPASGASPSAALGGGASMVKGSPTTPHVPVASPTLEHVPSQGGGGFAFDVSPPAPVAKSVAKSSSPQAAPAASYQAGPDLEADLDEIPF